MFSMFKNLVGSKTLAAGDVAPVVFSVLDKMKDHLIAKNMALDIAQKLCDSVAAKREGKVLGTFGSLLLVGGEWLSVLIAAGNIFCSGAVEQLRILVRKLNVLHPSSRHGREMVQLYERDYGKDASGIAMEAIASARDYHIDVVLVDTAWRMQDNEPLMRALSKVGAAISVIYITGQPIVFVGTGQTYSDLRNLNAKAVVSALLK